MAVEQHSLARQDDQQRGIAIADPEAAAGALAHILATGDLSRLSNEQRVAHYLNQCSSLGLNPISRPFDWLILDGKLVLYPNKSCAEQLRRQHQITVKVTRQEVIGDKTDEPMCVVSVEGRTPNGRTDESTKYVPLMAHNKQGQRYRLSGQNLANAYAKAETGAKRRLVLSMIGLAAPPDVDELKGARVVVVDGRGNVLENPTQEQRALAANPEMARAIKVPTYEDMGAEAAPLAGVAASQAVRPDELERPARPDGPAPTFRADVDRWLGAWFAAVAGSRYDDDDARHAWVLAYTTDNLPERLRTSSLRLLLSRSTDRQAGDVLALIRSQVEADREAQALGEVLDGPEDEDDGYEAGADVGLSPERALEEAIRQGDPSARPAGIDERGHAAVQLTGGPGAATQEPVSTPRPPKLPEEIDLRSGATGPQLVEQYQTWSAVLVKLDAGYVPKYSLDSLSSVPFGILLTAVEALIPRVKAEHARLTGAGA